MNGNINPFASDEYRITEGAVIGCSEGQIWLCVDPES